jgi:serine/threonine protein kinase/sugar lactone lactonase YvrE
MKFTEGAKLGRYEIRSLIGVGGMGEVYRASDPKIGRDVAIKVLPAVFAADKERVARFEQEAQAAGALNHPNILAIHDVDTQDNVLYVVSELLEGEELRQRLDEGPVPLRKVTEYAQQIVSGLSAAHEKGIVHRDLKPENLFITKDDRVKILDFGLAKLRAPKPAADSSEDETRKAITNPGVVMGTVGYMSPEQVRGHATDHRSDIFSFGVIVHEMITGRRAFRRETMAETMSAILKEEPEELSESNPNISPSLVRIVHRCLEKKPERRFQTASDLGFALESLSAPTSSSGSSLTTIATAVAAPSSLRFWQILALAAMLAAVAVSVGAFILVKRAGTTLPPSYQRLTFNRGTIWNARFAPDGQTVVYSARWNGDPLDVFSARPGKTESRSLKLDNTDVLAISAANEMAVLRNRQDPGSRRGTLARMPVDGGAARDILEDVQEADWSPDGTKLAVVRWVNGRNQLEYPIGKVLYETAGYISHPRVSPRGDLVAFMDHQVQWDNRGWVAVVDPAGKKTVLAGEWSSEEGLAWNPAGDEVWFTADRGGESNALYAVTLSGSERLVLRTASELQLHDISRDGHVLLDSYTDTANIAGLLPGEAKERDFSWLDQGWLSDFSPDGKTILIHNTGEGAGINYAVYLRRTDATTAVRLGDGDGPRLSADGKWALAVLFTPPQLVLLPTGAGEARQLVRGPIEQYGKRCGWFPDGKQIVFEGREPGREWRLYVQSIEGGLPRPITPEGTTGSSREIFISPDGRFVIALDAQHQTSFYPVEGGAAQPISNLEDEDDIIGWSSDGTSLYVARVNGMPIRVYRFEPATGRRVLLKEVMPADPAGIAVPNIILMTPDGKGYMYSIRRHLSDLYVVEGLR